MGHGMSLRELYTSPALSFLASERPFEEAEWAFLGVPLDVSSSNRPGSRLGPLAIRQASKALELHSLLTSSNLPSLSVCDVGDLHVSQDVAETLRRLSLVVEEVLKAGKHLAIAGGEHTVTLGIVQGLKEALGGVKVIMLDAHLDLRDEFLGQRICHATVAKRVLEAIGPGSLAIVGARACSEEEAELAEDVGLLVITSLELREKGITWAVSKLEGFLGLSGAFHISLDLDVLDPAFAPAVQTPEPFGITPWEALELLLSLIKARRGSLASIDVVELTPQYDTGQTALLAARLLVEAMWAASHQA